MRVDSRQLSRWGYIEDQLEAQFSNQLVLLSSHMPASTSDVQTSEQTQDNEDPLDVNLLKELGKKALIDALNSVRIF